ncbi:MAG: IPT/TIG domain-containing protein [Arthrospira platensis]
MRFEERLAHGRRAAEGPSVFLARLGQSQRPVDATQSVRASLTREGQRDDEIRAEGESVLSSRRDSAALQSRARELIFPTADARRSQFVAPQSHDGRSTASAGLRLAGGDRGISLSSPLVETSALQNPDGTYSETVGGEAHTWTDYTDAGGTQGPTIPAYATVEIQCVVQGFAVSDGNTNWYLIASSPWNYQYFVSADAFYNNGQTSGSLVGTPYVDPSVPACNFGGTPETAGGSANTWTDYTNAGGTQGPSVGGGSTIAISCKLQGFRVQDGNTWWYRIGQPPWNGGYYVSADAFYNNGQTSGSLAGTPFYDSTVPDCPQQPAPPGAIAETAGGNANTWTNFQDAGGTQGPTIQAGTTVAITCKITGFQVQDGNTWWYLIHSAPWSDNYFVSADAFYNNGQTSGSLLGTPFVDNAVPDCISSGPRPVQEVPSAQIVTWANYSHPGGEQGPPISSGQTVSVSCRAFGYAGSDGDPWWYRLASAPWNDVYYVQAGVFPVNGQTGQVDTAVPVCQQNVEAPLYGTAIGAASATAHSTGGVDGQVDGASGDFWVAFTDLSIPARGPSLSLSRTYNALEPTALGLFGYGWSSPYDQHLVFNGDGSITAVLEDGSEVTATSSGGSLTLPAWSKSTLIANPDGTYTLTRNATLLETFAGPGSSGRLISIGDLNGNRLALTYDGLGHLSSITDGSGRAITIAIGSNGFISSATDPIGRQATYAYSPAGDLESVALPLGRVWQYAYDANHRMTSLTDPRGNTAQNTFDSQGRVTSQTDPVGLKTAFAYSQDNFSSLGGTTTITDPHGVVRVEHYANGFMTEDTNAYGTANAATWVYTYDPTTYALLSTVDPLSHATSNTYDSAGNVLTSTDATGEVTSYTYNALNEALSTTSPLGKTTRRTYDAHGNLLTVVDPLGNTTTNHYDDPSHTGDLTSTADPDGRTTAFAYDTAGDRISTTVTPAGGTSDTTRSVFDTDGEKVCEASANATATGISCPAPGGAHVASTTSWTLDEAGRVATKIDANGGSTRYEYDADGNVVGTVDPDGAIVAKKYDADGRVSSVETDPSPSSKSISTNAYDITPGSSGCPATATYCDSTTNPDGATTIEVFDSQGDQVERIRPNGQTVLFGYDAVGDPIQEVDARGITTSFSYDADGRRTAVSYSDSTPTVSTAYNADGERTSMTDGSGTSTFSYDADGRPTSMTNGAGQTVAYTYDGAGDVVSLTYPGGRKVVRTFDGAREITTLTDWNGNTMHFRYDHDQNLTTTTSPGGTAVNDSYDVADALKRTSLTNVAKVTLAAIAYTRDSAEQITKEQDTGGLTGGITYGYDGRHGLITAGGTKYALDAAGQATSFGGVTQAFDAAGQLTSTTQAGSTTTNGYDADGDLVSRQPGWGTPSKADYDAAGKLLRLTSAVPTPQVGAIAPTSGSDVGGASVTLTGTGFSDATTVSFGGQPAASFTTVSDTKIVAVAPSGATGGATVTVSTPAGTSTATGGSVFTYKHTAAITGMSPTAGPPAGGTNVTITGGDFTGATKVLFGTTSVPFSLISDTKITAVAPAGIGTVRVQIQTAHNGSTAAVTSDQFTYAAGPVVTKLSPSAGPVAGSTTIVIAGSSFTGATGVTFGGTPATSFTVDSDNQIHATTPAGAGTKTVTVQVGATNSTAAGSATYTYDAVPTITNISQVSGPDTGGTTVVVHGTGFTAGAVVSFGGDAAPSKYLAPGVILTVAPAGSGTVDIAVDTPGGESASSVADRFSYVAPVTSYGYNGDGLRVDETTAAGTRNVTWDENASTPAILDDQTASYVYGPDGLPLEQIDDASGKVNYFFHDAIGSTRMLIDNTGATAATFKYTPYGDLQAQTGSASTPLLYAGGYRDADTNLTYLESRFYDPAIGQFTSLDPAVDSSGDPYAYAGGNPINGTDPLGLHFNWMKAARLGIDIGVAGAGIACALAEPCGAVAETAVFAANVAASGADIYNSCSVNHDGCSGAIAQTVLFGHDFAWAHDLPFSKGLLQHLAPPVGGKFFEVTTSLFEGTAAVGVDSTDGGTLSAVPAAVTAVLSGSLQVRTASPGGPISIGRSSSQSQTYNPQPSAYNPQPAASIYVQGGGALPYGAHISGVTVAHPPRLSLGS